MNKLTIINQNGILLTDSREVAEMTGKQHSHLLRDIQGYISILGKSDFGLADFFVESNYIDVQSKERTCYLLTRKGCDMVANKMTGEKGVLFTAEYVTEFDNMKNNLDILKTQKLVDKILEFEFAIEEAKRQFKPSHSKKLQYNKLIKQLAFTDDEFIAIQTFVFAMLGVDKWENTAIEDGPKIMELINTSAALISSKQFQQTKLY